MTDILARWYSVKQQLNALQQEENELRKAVVEQYFPTETGGTIELDNNWKLVCTKPVSYNLDQKKAPILKEKLVQKFGPLAENLFRIKHELNTVEYRKLHPNFQKEFEGVLEIKPGKPQLKLEQKK